MKEELIDKLKKYCDLDVVPMHMPGHKRKSVDKSIPYEYDITEIDGFDNLQSPNGILKESMDYATSVFGGKGTFYSVNGSTGGIMGAIRAITKSGDKVIVARNCHKSVYNAIELCSLNSVFVMPDIDKETGIVGSLNPKQLEKVIEDNKDAVCVILTNPTYEGVLSDIKTISKLCHKNNMILIVDGAHGAHLFLEDKSAVKYADITIQSLHKTLPSLTQTAIVSYNGNLIDEKKLQDQINVFQSTSPSYILLSSIDSCVHFLAEHGKEYYDNLKRNIDILSKKLKKLKNLVVLSYGNDKKHKSFYDFDRTKIVVSSSRANITGYKLMDILREKYKIECEMAYEDEVVLLTSIFDEKNDFERVLFALLEIDQTLTFEKKENVFLCEIPSRKLPSHVCFNMEKELVELDKAQGKVCGDYVYVYPPGIPILVPGEVISDEIIRQMKGIQKLGFGVKMNSREMENTINVIKF